jgi:hypothetical protein
MKLNKELVDEAIRLNKKYYMTSDQDICKLLIMAEDEAFGVNSNWIRSIMSGITCKKSGTYDEPNETYYKVLEVLGFEVVEDEKEKD